MPHYRDDILPPLGPPWGETPGEPTPIPESPTPELEDPDVPDFPEGSGAGGDFDRSDDYDEPEPDFESDPDYGYDGPDDYGGKEDDNYRIAQRENRCIQARHALFEAIDQMQANERAIEREREKLAEARHELLECGSGRIRVFAPDARGRLREVGCEESYQRRIQRSEHVIETRQNEIERLRSQLPVLRQRVDTACAGA